MLASDSTETNECRSSRGVHSAGSIPGTWRSARRRLRPRLAASISVPFLVVNTSPLSCQASPPLAARPPAAPAASALRRCTERGAPASVETSASWCPHPRGRTAGPPCTASRGGGHRRPSKWTCSQRRARSSSVRAPVSRETMMYGCRRSAPVPKSTASTCQLSQTPIPGLGH
jgi:hypothetical protein